MEPEEEIVFYDSAEEYMNFYKELWSRIGGRKWTYILRDIWHKYEGVCIIVLVACGAVLTHYFGLKYTLIGLGIFCIGYIAGHLFWAKPYIPGQGTDKEGEWNG